MVKNLPVNVGDTSLIPGLGRSPGEGNDNPFQYSCLENPMDSGACKVEVLVAQSSLTLCDPMDCNLPGSTVHGILQARTLEWVAIPFSRGSSQPRDQTWVSCTPGRFSGAW